MASGANNKKGRTAQGKRIRMSAKSTLIAFSTFVSSPERTKTTIDLMEKIKHQIASTL
jgi:hypothetical protein